MCGVKDALVEPPKLNFNNNGKRESNDQCKEKSRDAARSRRSKESEYFQELEDLIPVHGTPPHSQMASIDKTSLIRLTVSFLRTRDLISNAGIPLPQIKEEESLADCMDVLTALNGFGIVMNQEQDIVYVTNNVSEYIGLTAFELLGQPMAEFVHPCDYTVIRNLIPTKITEQTLDLPVKASIRVKSTITDRGRLINLKQANYKALKLEGKIRVIPGREEGGLHGPLFIGMASLVSNPFTTNLMSGPASGVFETKHSQDFKFLEADSWLSDEGGYPFEFLQGESFFRFIHAEDTSKVSAVLAKLAEHTHVETDPYRMLVGGGGYVYVETTGAYVTPRRGSSKGTTILLRHSIITEILDAGQIIDLVQMQEGCGRISKAAGPRPTITAVRRLSTPVVQQKPVTDMMKTLEFAPTKFEEDTDDIVEALKIFGGPKDSQTSPQLKKEMEDIIVDLVSPLNDDNYVDLLAELPVQDQSMEASWNIQDVTCRSSVIVRPKTEKCLQPVFEAVTEKLFEDAFDNTLTPQFNAVTEKLFTNETSVELPNMTNQLFVDDLFKEENVSSDFTDKMFESPNAFSSPREFNAITEQLFRDESSSDSYATTSGASQHSPTHGTLGYDQDIIYPLKDIFGNLQVEDLEKLSPFIGDECISFAKGGVDETDDLMSMGFESFDDFEFPEEKFGFNASTEKMFVQDDDVLVGNQSNIMWGGADKDSVSCSSNSSLLSPRSDPVTPVTPPVTDLRCRDISPLPKAQQDKILYEQGVFPTVNRDMRRVSLSNSGQGGVIVEREQPMTSIPSGPSSSGTKPAMPSPRYVIVPARDTNMYKEPGVANSEQANALKENRNHDVFSAFIKSVPLNKPLERPGSDISRATMGISTQTFLPTEVLRRRGSVFRNVGIDDSVKMIEKRGEKRVAEPSIQNLQQPASKQIRLATDMETRPLTSNIISQTNGRPIIMSNVYILQELPRPGNENVQIVVLDDKNIPTYNTQVYKQ